MEPARTSFCAILPPWRAAHLARLAATSTKGQHEMGNLKGQPRVTSLAPQFLVDDLARSIAYYQKLGFTFGEPWDGFYAIGQLDGLELHLKEAPKNADTGVRTSTSTRRPVWTASRRSMLSAQRTAQRS